MGRRLLAGILFLFSTTLAHADVISVPAFSADSTVTHLETFRTTVVNVVNGSIQGAGGTGATRNIGVDSVAEIDMYDDANPRVRDSELLTNTYDTFASGTLTQNSFVASGCVPATDVDLNSDISACVAYVNGYRISKGATSETYTASMDTYVDLSQSGVYTLSAVANGATQPTVASNSARIAKVVTSGTAITSVTDLARRSLTGLNIPINYRTGLVISKDSATTIKVLTGSAEINSTIVSKTSPVTLTLGTSGDWAGGVSLAAADIFGFVGEDASGNLKLHTTAPTHTNYAVSATDGKKRYATWSATVYRILGWFYMGTATNIDVASNLKEGDVSNSVMSNDATSSSAFSSTTMGDIGAMPFYNSGGNMLLMSTISGDAAAGIVAVTTDYADGSTALADSDINTGFLHSAGYADHLANSFLYIGPSQASRLMKTRASVSSSNIVWRTRRTIITEQ